MARDRDRDRDRPALDGAAATLVITIGSAVLGAGVKTNDPDLRSPLSPGDCRMAGLAGPGPR
ncbi:hypothetical protein ABZU76_15295 [Amycolatopsis sp. NPDC005232]|uniref:hypothetical protein n=1 Tax=Amycolatopsis sp. NPDC005232 TaxID=3157027 RepID=UPI0033A81568